MAIRGERGAPRFLRQISPMGLIRRISPNGADRRNRPDGAGEGLTGAGRQGRGEDLSVSENWLTDNIFLI